MADIKTLTSKKVAGVPVLWLLGIVAVAGLYAAIKMRTTPDTQPTDAQATDSGGGDLPDTSQPVFQATPTIIQPSGPLSSISSTPGQDTNELWGRRSIEWLIAQGNSVDVATTVISKYLDGSSLTLNESQIRDTAVIHFGLPPEGITPTSTTPPGAYKGPFTAQGVPPLTHIVKGKSDDTFAELARGYYGLNSKQAIVFLHGSNPNLVGSEPFAPGVSVMIPPEKQVKPNYFTATKHTHTLYAIAAKNGRTAGQIQAFNPNKHFPVKPGTKVRVG